MSKWLYEVDIKQYITNDETWIGLAKAANSIASELRFELPLKFFSDDYDLDDHVSFLECVDEEDRIIYESESELLYEINYALSCIYTFADENRIWLG